eukprot:Hpha_TRINITY_DN15555_c0_g2::TRINITY_DN15555_c0_g2_i1::g.108793::m.108793
MAENTSVIAPCRHWHRLGQCRYGNTCKFGHTAVADDAGNDGAGKEPGKPPAVTENILSGSPSTHQLHNERKRRPCGRPVVRNSGRCSIFRKFIFEKYLEGKSNVKVLDVAGGKGELAFQFAHLSAEVGEVTIVDPRPMQIKKYETKLRLGNYGRSGVLLNPHNTRGLSSESVPDDASDAGAAVLDHLHCFFRPELWISDERWAAAKSMEEGVEDEADALDECPPCEPLCEVQCEEVTEEGGQEQGQRGQDAEACLKAYLKYNVKSAELSPADVFSSQNATQSRVWHWKDHGRGKEAVKEEGAEVAGDEDDLAVELDFAHARRKVAETDSIVGMHPDQAAEYIIDAALAMKKTFFVVPCLAFKNLFKNPNRAACMGRSLYGEKVLPILRYL